MKKNFTIRKLREQYQAGLSEICRGAILSSFLLCIGYAIQAQLPVINSVSMDKSSISRYERIEWTVQFEGSYTNPYDYDDVLVKINITTPSGANEVAEGFFMEDYNLNITTGNLTPAGTSQFRIRYTPREVGLFIYSVSVKNLIGQTTTVPAQFSVIGTAGKGFVRRGNSNYLIFEDGSQYIMIGQNLCWQQNQKYLNFKNWTDNLAANGANFIRLWQCYWGLGLEWTARTDIGTNGIYNGLKRYSQINAFYTDKLIEQIEAKDIYMMLCINHHGMVSTSVNPEWNTSPYNVANGGPCNNTWDYFTNATAKNLHKNRLRYIVARWGYSKNIMSWELFNEVEWTDQYNTYRSVIKTWHDEMAQFLKEKDPSKHLVTTSFAHDNNDTDTWNLSSIDFTQTHYYNGSANMETVLAEGIKNYLNLYSKPTYTGEFGVNTSQSSLSTADPNGIHIHNALWATLFGGGMGTGATWWWDSYIGPRNLYYHYKAPAAISAKMNLSGHRYQPAVGAVSGGSAGELVISPGFGWGRSPANSFQIDLAGNMTPAASNLGSYIYGAQCKSAERNSPSFSINLPSVGEFKVRTADVSPHCNAQRIVIRVNNTERLNLLAAANTTYTIALPAGASTVSIDNGGGDWFRVSAITISGIGSALNTYLLKSEDAKRVAGWIHNKKYNWIDAGPSGSLPSAVSGTMLQIPGMVNGSYEVKWYDCLDGNVVHTLSANATGGILNLSIPDVAWDLTFIATEVSTLPVFINSFNGIYRPHHNELRFGLSSTEQVKRIEVQRSTDCTDFTTIGEIVTASNTWGGQFSYIDSQRPEGAVFYRLLITVQSGLSKYSAILLLKGSGTNNGISIFPNPLSGTNIFLQVNGMLRSSKYELTVTDLSGKVCLRQPVALLSDGSSAVVLTKHLAVGAYIFSVVDAEGHILTRQTIIRQ